MDFNEYQRKAKKTTIYPLTERLIYPTLGLTSEAGEVAGKVKKILRGDTKLTTELREEIKKELGDTLWYISAIATDLYMELNEIAETNIEKLQERKEKNTLKGNGDKR